jgi:hypothetical protein
MTSAQHELKILDACLNELEMAHERGETSVPDGLAAVLSAHVPEVSAGMSISGAIEHIFRAQEHPLKRRRSWGGLDGARGSPVTGSTVALASTTQLDQLQSIIRQTRDMIQYVSSAREAALLVRRANGIEKLVDEALKSCQILEEEQFELKQEVAEAHLRTQRRAGELLLDLDKNAGGRPAQTSRSVRGVSRADEPPTLRELGISPSDSYRWQLIASLPPERFETCIVQARVARKELTTSRVLALARRLRQGSHLDGVETRSAVAIIRYELETPHVWSLVALDPAAIAARMDADRRQRELDALARWRAWLDSLEQALRMPDVESDGKR